MALPPISFQRPARPPSLVQQAIIGTLTSLAKKKLIDEPMLNKQLEFYQQQQTERLDRADALARRRGVTDPIELATLKEARRATEPRIPGMEESRDAMIRVLERATGATDANPTGGWFEPGPRSKYLPGQTEEMDRMQDLSDRLLAIKRVEAAEAATDAQTDRFMQQLILDARVDIASLPQMLIRTGPEPTDIRLPTGTEQSLRGLREAGEAVKILGAGGESANRIELLLAQAAKLDLVPVPDYSPELETQFLGTFNAVATPNSRGAGMLMGLITDLRRGGWVSGDDLGRVFINDNGEEIPTKTDEQMLALIPSAGISRLKGALWHMWFPTLESFERAKLSYNLNDPVAEQTYRTLVGSPIAAQPRLPGFGPPGPESVIDTESAKKARREQPLVSEEALELMGSVGSGVDSTETDGVLRDYIEKFQTDPLGYVNAMDVISDMIALPDDSLRTKLIDIGYLPPMGPVRVGPRGFAMGPSQVQTLPERDSIVADLSVVINAAEAEVRARRNRSPSEGGGAGGTI